MLNSCLIMISACLCGYEKCYINSSEPTMSQNVTYLGVSAFFCRLQGGCLEGDREDSRGACLEGDGGDSLGDCVSGDEEELHGCVSDEWESCGCCILDHDLPMIENDEIILLTLHIAFIRSLQNFEIICKNSKCLMYHSQLAYFALPKQ